MNENFSIIYDGIYQAAERLFMLGAAYVIYIIGRSVSKTVKTKLNCYLTVLSIAILLGLYSYSTLGSHIENADPVFGVGGETVYDFEPNDAERLKHGVETFIISGTLLVFGAVRGFQQNKNDVDRHHIPSFIWRSEK